VSFSLHFVNGIIHTWNGVAIDLMTIGDGVRSALYHYQSVTAMTMTDVHRTEEFLRMKMLWKYHSEKDFLNLDLKKVTTDLKTIDHLWGKTSGVLEPRSFLAPIRSHPIHFVMPLYHPQVA
jgi:hypothetical protein